MGESIVVVKDRGELKVFEDVDDLATSLAYYISELSEAAVKKRGAFAIVLSGGSVIRELRHGLDCCPVNYLKPGSITQFGENRKLTEVPYLKTVDWAKWHVFWADERVVAKNHPDSNYKQAKEGLLSKVFY
eukprot:Gb_04811 [translate_table: standard]